MFESFRSLFRGKQDHQLVNINALALEAVELMRKELENHAITMRINLASELPPILANAGQLREVLLNLVQNALEATSTTDNRPRVISVITETRGSASLAITVEDTGPGIDAKQIASIFDPFVTTKTTGSGLGLAICKMIVEQHGGTLSAVSDDDGGARFEMTLPTKIAVASVEDDMRNSIRVASDGS